MRYSTATVRRVTVGIGGQLQAQHAGRQAVSPASRPAWDFSLADRDGQRFAGNVA
ncbi:MAG TPA: hypothetical protein VKU60_04260 [Chloroflexota bacterium]|nr:hypothetical protein [Chloroflexota bacterium]